MVRMDPDEVLAAHVAIQTLDPGVGDASALDAVDAEWREEFEAWCAAAGVEASAGSVEEFLAAVNNDDELPIEAQPPPTGLA